LPPNLIRFCLVSDLLWSGIHIALTARCELDSRSVACLEEAQRADEQREKQRQSEDRAHSVKNKQEGDGDARGEGRYSKHQALAALARPNVGNAHSCIHC
jgi:hypothetical protein